MKLKKSFLPVLTFILLLSACTSPLAQTPQLTLTPAPPVTVEPPTPAPTTPPLTVDMLMNATYMLPFYGRTVTLTNGTYQEGAGAEIYSVGLVEPLALGDLNGDGLEDAAVILYENGGGSGVFVSLVAMLNQDGAPVQAGVAQLGDRIQVNPLAIQDGHILLDMLVQGPNDPLCCPTEPVTQAYRLFNNGLFLMHATTKVASGGEHSIMITSPTNNAEVTNPVTVIGSITLSPFENTLVYRVYNVANVKVEEMPFMVDATEMGGPGTFTFTFDLTNAAVTGPIRIEIIDISMADGSTVALEAINLVLK